MKKIIKIFIGIAFAISLVIFLIINAISQVKEAQENIKSYVQESDYYFSGTIIGNYPQDDSFARLLIIKPDSFYLKKISYREFKGAYSKKLNEVVFLTGYSMFDESNDPSYIIVDSKKDTIIFDLPKKSSESRLVPIVTIQLKENLNELIYSRGDDWVKF